jgi:hypothetical protein
MIFKLGIKKDLWLDNEYEKSMKELDDFFGVDWTQNRPKIFVLPNRKTIDAWMGEKTPSWVTGFGGRRSGGIFLLDRKNYQKESGKTYTADSYGSLIKHELCHCFMDILTNNFRNPKWLSEGLCIYLAWQLPQYTKPEKFVSFLESTDKFGTGLYQESGFAVEYLVETFGKEKMIALLKELTTQPDNARFKEIFMNIYGGELSYDFFRI